MIKLPTFILLFTIALFNSVFAKEEDKKRSSPVMTVEIPKDHFYLVAIDRGEEGNRTFLKSSKPVKTVGVDPIQGNMMRLAGKVNVSLEYPKKRENVKERTLWTVRSGVEYSQKRTSETSSLAIDLTLKIGYNLMVATKIQKVIYQHEGRVYQDYERQIIETPVPIVLEEVDTGMEGFKLYQIPFASVDGVIRYILILIGDDLDSAHKVLAVSDRNPKFKWSLDWFSELTDIEIEASQD